MPAAERREQVLQAAERAFAAGGFAGTSTDQVAREAGVSQPYVVRMFGTKADLFRDVFARATARVVGTMRAAAQAEDPRAAMGAAYVGLLDDRDLLRVMMHGFVGGEDPVIGDLARQTLLDVYRLARDLPGASPDEARAFVAQGMLINVLVAVRAAEHASGDLDMREFVECALGADVAQVAASRGSAEAPAVVATVRR